MRDGRTIRLPVPYSVWQPAGSAAEHGPKTMSHNGAFPRRAPSPREFGSRIYALRNRVFAGRGEVTTNDCCPCSALQVLTAASGAEGTMEGAG